MTENWLPRALEESRARGFLGPGPIEQHIEHAMGFVSAWSLVEASAPTSVLDLGSGGGVPGFILSTIWTCRVVLLDSMIRRTTFLEEAATWEGSPPSLEVVTGRAEELGRGVALRESVDLVVSRSFGPPAVTAECASAFVKPGGLLIVSEPPGEESQARWQTNGLRELSLESLGRHRFGAAFQILRKSGPLNSTYPRRNGIPAKSPLF